MRVIAGKARGHPLRTVRGLHTRPTTDRVKESLFGMLQPWIAEAQVLDLFAGSGALGIEALSRGAARAVFVERSREAVAVIRANLAATGLAQQAEVWPVSVERALAQLATQGETFDLILMDPPYEHGLVVPTLAAIHRNGLLRPGGLIAVEHSAKEEVAPPVVNFVVVRSRAYGQTRISLLARADEGAHGQRGADPDEDPS